MERMKKNTGRPDPERIRRISNRMIFYAGLALCRERPEEFDVLTEKGRRLVERQLKRTKIEPEEVTDLPGELREPEVISRGERPEALSSALGSELAAAARLWPGTEWPESDEASSRMPRMIEAMTPSSVPTAPAVLQARRNSEARMALIEEFGLLTSSDVAELSQSQAENRAALASRWSREGKIFSVKHHSKDYFPGFQLRADGRPRAIIASVLNALGGACGWETALWFTGANGYLDGRRPVDLLESEPEAVIGAAEHEGAEVYF